MYRVSDDDEIIIPASPWIVSAQISSFKMCVQRRPKFIFVSKPKMVCTGDHDRFGRLFEYQLLVWPHARKLIPVAVNKQCFAVTKHLGELLREISRLERRESPLHRQWVADKQETVWDTIRWWHRWCYHAAKRVSCNDKTRRLKAIDDIVHNTLVIAAFRHACPASTLFRITAAAVIIIIESAAIITHGNGLQRELAESWDLQRRILSQRNTCAKWLQRCSQSFHLAGSIVSIWVIGCQLMIWLYLEVHMDGQWQWLVDFGHQGCK